MFMQQLLLVLVTVLAALIQVANGQAYYTVTSTKINGGPQSLSVNSDNEIWVCQNNDAKVSIMTNANVLITSISGPCGTVAVIDDKAWVSKYNGMMQIYNAKSPYNSLGSPFKVGDSIAARVKQHPNGKIWVTFTSDTSVAVLNPTTYAISASATIERGLVRGIDFDSSNNGWIAIAAIPGKLHRITQDTMAVSAAFGITYLVNPFGVGVDSSDNVWVASFGDHKVVKFDNNGNYLEEYAASSPRAMFFNKYRNSMFGAVGAQVLEFTLSSPITIVDEYTVGTGAYFISMDGLQNVWSASSGGTVSKLAVPTKSPTTRSPTPPTSSPTKSPTRSPTPPTSSPTKSPTRSPTRFPTSSPTRSPSKSPTRSPSKSPTQPTSSPTTSPTTSHCNVLTLPQCNADPECIWFPIKNGVSACRARELVAEDCSQYLSTTACKAPGRPLIYCIWNVVTQKCVNRFTPNPTTGTALPTPDPTTQSPTSGKPTKKPTTNPTKKPTRSPSKFPSTKTPTRFPTTLNPTTKSPTDANTPSPTASPTSPCDKIASQTSCTGTTGCKWTIVKGSSYACRSGNWGYMGCSTLKTLADCQKLVDGVSFCVWDKPNKTCKARFNCGEQVGDF